MISYHSSTAKSAVHNGLFSCCPAPVFFYHLPEITIALTTIPNLFEILSLSKEIKSEVNLFWKEWEKRFRGEKVPK
jgi:Na+/alanine symporter